MLGKEETSCSPPQAQVKLDLLVVAIWPLEAKSRSEEWSSPCMPITPYSHPSISVILAQPESSIEVFQVFFVQSVGFLEAPFRDLGVLLLQRRNGIGVLP
ncbi:hypothetical protein AMTR_s00013p00252230 [Amborella trichopoda]|uniref:Uncharacterized protein n=1 Tax=Amborella trichopoda TaxID=13333 RepID=W1PQH7_AMBTC|nr:hypothetical protein AMTR_s00013p00252230 [Amborella trichopoda]